MLSWNSVDALLRDQDIRTPDFRMARDNQLVRLRSITRTERATSQGISGLADPVQILAELGKGATLILQGVHRYWPPLRSFARTLAAEIGHAVFVNAYLTPRSAQGFGAHHDPYHAWLAQTEGAKTWRLWSPEQDPTSDLPHQEVLLEEGDVLWIPRGWWHAGSSGDRPSLHLTITVWATTVRDVLCAALDEIPQHDLDRELPPNALRDAPGAWAAMTDARTGLAELIGQLDADRLAERLVEARVDRFDPLPPGPVSMVLGLGDAQLVHAHPEGVLYRVVDGSGMRLRTADRTIQVAPELVGACDELLSRAGAFALPEPGEPPSADQKLLSSLLEARLLCAAACSTEAAER